MHGACARARGARRDARRPLPSRRALSVVSEPGASLSVVGGPPPNRDAAIVPRRPSSPSRRLRIRPCAPPAGAPCIPQETAADLSRLTPYIAPKDCSHAQSRPICHTPQGLCKHPTGSVCKHPTGCVCKHPTGSVCKHPTGCVCKHPTGCVCKHPTGCVCKHPTGCVCKHPTGCVCKHPTGCV